MAVSKIWEATAFINKNSFVGNVKRIELPTIANTTGDYETLGMAGTIRLSNGKEAMECTIGWDGSSAILATTTYNLEEVQDLMVRYQIENQNGMSKTLIPVVVSMKGIFRSKEGGVFEPKSDMTHESVMDVFYYKEQVGGVDMVEFDPVNNIFTVGGKDLWAERRRNLGL